MDQGAGWECARAGWGGDGFGPLDPEESERFESDVFKFHQMQIYKETGSHDAHCCVHTL